MCAPAAAAARRRIGGGRMSCHVRRCSMKARKLWVALALVAAVVFGAAGLSAGSGGLTPVGSDEAQAAHGAVCANIYNYGDGCGANGCAVSGTLYSFDG